MRQLSQHASPPIGVGDEALLRTAIVGIADACVPDRDERLAFLLGQAIEETRIVLVGDDRVSTPHASARTAVGAKTGERSPALV